MFLKINILSRKKLLITFRNWVLSILTKACYKRHATYRTLSLTLVRFRIQTEIKAWGYTCTLWLEFVIPSFGLSYNGALCVSVWPSVLYTTGIWNLVLQQFCRAPTHSVNCADASVWLWAEILVDRNTDYWHNGLSLIAGVSRTKYCQILYLLMYWFRIAKSLYHIIIWLV